jgi:hypothetical protein
MNRIIKSKQILFFFALLILFNIRLIAFGSHNHVHIIVEEFLSILGLQTAFFLLLTGLARLIGRSWDKALDILTYVVPIWALGSFASIMIYFSSFNAVISTVYISIFILAGLWYLIKYHKNGLRLVTSIFAITFLFMQIPGLLKISKDQESSGVFHDIADALDQDVPASMPHIIYVVPDRYANNNTLNDLYDYDNTSFTNDLENRGFYVWKNQYSNYPKTFLSIASTLNMNYLGGYTESLDEGEENYIYIYMLMQDYQAQRVLKSIGYSYNHIGSWWGPTKFNYHADKNFFNPKSSLSEIESNYLLTTPLNFLLFIKGSEKNECELEEDKIDFIKSALESDQPQFIYWHSLITHDPYIYNADGSCAAQDKERHFIEDWEGRAEKYIEHVGHFNRIILTLFDHINETSKRPVIFVIQADEGPFPYKYLNEKSFGKYNFLDAESTEILRKHSIINAIYFPDGNYKNFDTQRTPINNFRFILSNIYGKEIPLLDHSVFTFKYDNDPYDLIDITDKVLKDE